jgi:DNA-binding transcriptional ArsR family regulator
MSLNEAMPTVPSPELLDATFAALADPTRRAIVARLAEGETHVGDLVQRFPISGPAISRHLRVLEDAGLIERQVDARWRICRLRPDALRDAHAWLSRYRDYWEHSLDRLAELLEDPAPPAAPAASPSSAATRRRTTAARTPRTPKTHPRKPR